jgi:hypothetical protein
MGILFTHHTPTCCCFAFVGSGQTQGRASIDQALEFSRPPLSDSSRRMGWIGVLAALVMGASVNRLSPSCRATPRQRYSARCLRQRFSLAYGLWRELNSLPHRILENHERGLSENGLHLGAVIQILPDGVRQRDADGHNRIADIQNLQKARPQSTPLDRLLYLEGREAGLASCAHSGHIPRYRTSS